ncbi:4'-phosphopantetheinyl transferase superfamily protein [Actinoplanes sp. NPDC049548]|uniref:holo-ACP synthase n=1 Tax=Actinoplanes sp. NPDC049548 TaxID=3155152 RepID=UPI00341762A0
MRDDVQRLLAGLDIGPGTDIGVGVDVEEVARWRRPAPGLFTEAEHAHCRQLARPAESYAGRWCAKEAVLKALSPFLAVSPRDIEIRPGPGGMPEPHLISAAGAGWTGRLRVSIAHTSTVAVAVAIAVPLTVAGGVINRH